MHKVYEEFMRINDTSKLDVVFVDFSLEITAELNMAAAVSRKAYQDYQKVIPVDKLVGFHSDNKLNDDEYKIFLSYEKYFEDYQKRLIVVDEDTTPSLFHDVLMEVAKKVGKFQKEARYISNCTNYELHNPNLYVIVLVDTVNLSEVEPDNDSIKASIDRMSRIAVWFRNKCRFTPIFIQQFNSEISATDRARYGISTPLLRDFEDSKRPTKDANIVCGLYDPMRHLKEDNPIFKGYDIAQLRSWFRSLHILKHRNGQSNKFIPLKFSGPVGMFEQLKEANEMTSQDYDQATRLT